MFFYVDRQAALRKDVVGFIKRTADGEAVSKQVEYNNGNCIQAT